MAVGTTAFPTALDTAVELVEAANNASTTLNGTLTIGATTITVSSTSLFPSSGLITIESEIISYTGTTATTFTGCTRGVDGTSAASHADTTDVYGYYTSLHHEALRGAIIAVETKLGSGSSTSTANTVLLGNGTGTSAWGAVTNAYIDASAAIAHSKMAAVTASRALVSDASGFLSASAVTSTELGYVSGVTSAIQTQLNAKGDASGPASATDNAIARFDGTGGKTIQDSVVTIADTSGNMAGVGTLNTHTIPGGTDTFAMLAASQTLTNKVLTAPDINGGTADALTSLGIRSTGSGAFDLTFANTENLTAGRTLTITVNDAARTLNLGGNLTTAADFITSGANSLTLTTTGATNVTLPTSGTLVTTGVTSLSSLATVGTITSGTWNGTAIGAQYGGTGLNTSASTGYPSLSAGTWSIVSATTLTAALDAMVGDSGSGGTKGLVPAPAAGDAAASKFLKADGTWATAGGGGLTVGTTAIASGTVGRVLYEASGNVLGEAAGITYQTGASPSTTITAQNASYVGLRINSAATPSTDVFQVSADNGTTTHFKVDSTGAPSAPRGTNGQIFGDSITVGAVTQPFSFGYGNSVNASYTMAIGGGLSTSGAGVGNNLYIGWSISNGNTGNSIAIGRQLGTAGSNVPAGSIVLGMNVSSGGIGTTLSAIFQAGTNDYPTNNVFFGKGWRAATPTAYTINGTGGSGTDIAGAAINIAGGKGTGTGTGGDVNIQFARAGTTGSSLNSLSTIMAFSGTTTATTATQTNVNGSTTITGQITESITLNTGGTTTDSTIDLPANSIILSVTARVTTTITTATAWRVGDATVDDRFTSDNSTLTAGTTDVGINQWKADRTTAGQGPYQASTAKVRITTTGTPGAGVVRITIHYITLTAPTS